VIITILNKVKARAKMKMKLRGDVVGVAISEAVKSPMLFRHGAVVVSERGEVRGRGYNNYISAGRGVEVGRRRSIHAERAALRKLSVEERRGVVVIAVRVGEGGDLREGAPCKGCQSFMRRCGVRVCVYRLDGEWREMYF